MRRSLTVAVALLALLGSPVALAQGTGGLVVLVTDGSGGVLPAATVTISHATGNVKTYTTLTSKKGRAEFPVLRPGGGYIVEVSMPSFGSRRETDIRVPIGEVATQVVQLSEQLTGFQINGVNNAQREFGRRFQLAAKLSF